MSKFIKLFAVAFALISTAYATTVSSKEIKQIENLELFKKAGIKVEKADKKDDLYLLNISIKGRADKIYLSKDKKYLIAGDVVNTTTGRPLSIPDMPVDIKITQGKEALTFGKGKDEYVLFTDPECPYCKKFESYFSQIENKVKIRVFFYPLSFHKNAKDISLYIMSQKGYEAKVKAMTTTKEDSEDFKNRKIGKATLEKLEKHLNEQMAIATKLGIRGTPSLFDTKGNKVNWVQMLHNYSIKVK